MLSAGDIIILAVLAAFAIAAVIIIVRRKKAGKGCGGSCAGCQYATGCAEAGHKAPPAPAAKK